MAHQPGQHIDVHAVAQTVEGKGTPEGMAGAGRDAGALLEPGHHVHESVDAQPPTTPLRRKGRCIGFDRAHVVK